MRLTLRNTKFMFNKDGNWLLSQAIITFIKYVIGFYMWKASFISV